MIIVAVFFLSLYSFGVIAHEVFFEKEYEIDLAVTEFIGKEASPQRIKIMEVLTFFGSSLFLFPAYLVLAGYFLVRKKFSAAIHIAVIGISSFLLLHALKRLFQRPRPDLPLIQSLKTFSFPSGHALSSFVFCSILGYLVLQSNLSKIWKWILIILLFIFSVSIGLSRIVLQVHYATDVIAGFCLGIFWVIVSFYIMNKVYPRKKVEIPIKENAYQ